MTEPTEFNPNQNQKPTKNPMDTVINQLTEASTKAHQAKLKEQAEKYLKAVQIAEKEKEVLLEMHAAQQGEKESLKKILSEIAL